MARHGVPTARAPCLRNRWTTRSTRSRSGALGWPVVVKADGLAAGKGVIIAADPAEAEAAVRLAMVDGAFGAAGARVVLEECLVGPELSYFVIAAGEHFVACGTAQDHKRLLDGDRGPNTGGMGAFSPSVLVDDALRTRIEREIVRPVLGGMAAEGTPFTGFLYCGLMLTAAGPKVIEFNCRFGDPEAQVVLPLLDEPLGPVLARAAAGQRAAGDAAASARCGGRRRARFRRLSRPARHRPRDPRTRPRARRVLRRRRAVCRRLRPWRRTGRQSAGAC